MMMMCWMMMHDPDLSDPLFAVCMFPRCYRKTSTCDESHEMVKISNHGCYWSQSPRDTFSDSVTLIIDSLSTGQLH